MKFEGKWIDLGIIILSEVTQIQKDKCHILSHTEVLAFYAYICLYMYMCMWGYRS